MFFKTENDSDDDYSASSETFPWLLEGFIPPPCRMCLFVYIEL